MNISIPVLGMLLGVQMLFAPLIALADHNLEDSSASSVEAMEKSGCHIEGNLTIGSRGESVICLQKHLIEDELLKISAPTGYFGEMTKAAVMKWQSKKGVPATGFFGALSREAFAGHHEEEEPESLPAMEAHPAIDAAQWQSVPSVSITAHPDAMSGYNLEITTQNFRFAPEHASSQALPNEGHAHLMVNGKKLARVYSNWFHIPADAFRTGENEVLLTLNANDHSDLQYQGKRIEAKQTITK